MQFHNFNLNKVDYFDILKSHLKETIVLATNELNELHEIIGYSIFESKYKIAINSITIGLCVSPNKLYDVIIKRGWFRYSNYINKKCIIPQLSKEILSICDNLNYNEYNFIKYLHSLIILSPILKCFKDIDTNLIKEINIFEAAYNNKSLPKTLLVYADSLFLIDYRPDRKVDMFDLQAWSKEEQCSAISSILFLISERFPALFNNSEVVVEEYILNGRIRTIIVLACILAELKEIEILIEAFHYTCSLKEKKIHIEPPSEIFEKAMKYGYIRSDIQTLNDVVGFKVEALSMQELVDKMYSVKEFEVFKYTETLNTPRYILQIPDFIITHLNKEILGENKYFEEDIFYLSYLFKEQLLDYEILKTIYIKSNLSLLDIIKIRRVLYFIYLLFSTKILEKHKKLDAIILRSLVPIYQRDSLYLLFKTFISPEQFDSFLELVSWTPESQTIFDLQYHPFVKFGNSWRVPLSLFTKSNFIRNIYASEYKKGNKKILSDGRELVDRLYSAFKDKGFTVHSNIKIPNSDIDVILYIENTLFIFECKHSLHPTSIYDLRTMYNYILKAEKQLTGALEALNDSKLRNTLHKKYQINLEQVNRVVPCLVTSNRMFNGDALMYPVRNIHEVINMIETGVMKTATGSYQIWIEDTLSVEDLVSYFSKGNKMYEYFYKSLKPRNIELKFIDPPFFRTTFFLDYESALKDMEEYTNSLRKV